MKIARIMIPVDFSDCARAALAYGLELSVAFGAELEVLHVFEPPYYVGDLMVQLPDNPAVSVHDYVREQSAKLLEEMLDSVEGLSAARPQKVLVAGNPADVIADKAKGADLVVMGTHGRTGLGHFLMGSVAEKVIRHTKTPVLVVRADGED